MKIDAASNVVVERDGIASDGAFSIQFNSKMAKILSNGLYSDKIQSIIRELSCNAIDSHVESNRANMPIEVHLPSQFEPWFHVRDFGVGLDHTQVISIYTVYGASTKTNSNQLIGQLGLGSKSPFSYVDAYDVTARKDGIERQYSMYKNEQGMPSVALLGEFVTSEPNGVTVKMPVKNEDIRRFSEKAVQVFTWFDVTPTITGVSSLTIPARITAYQGDGWQLRQRGSYGYHSEPRNRPVALMGRVAYPLDANSIGDLSDAARIMLTLPLVLTFNIGDLEIAASRESLGYDKRTQLAIQQRINTMLAELAMSFETRIASAKTEWEARIMFSEIFGGDSGFHYEFERAFCKLGLKWNNILIKDSHVTLSVKQLYTPITTSNVWPPIWRAQQSLKTARQLRHYDDITIRCNNTITVVFDDVGKGTASKINYLHCANHFSSEILLIGASDLKSVDDIAGMLGNPPYVMASTLPKRPTAIRQRVKMMQYDAGTGPGAWRSVDIDLDNGGIYVLLDRFTVIDGDNTISDLDDICNSAIDLGIITAKRDVYTPRAEMRKKVVAHDKWINFFDIVRTHLANKLTPAVLQSAADLREFESALHLTDDSMWKAKFKFNYPTGVYAQFVHAMTSLDRANAAYVKNRVLIKLARTFGTSIILPPPSVKPKELYEMIKVGYPMISLAYDRYSSRNITPTNINVYNDYINLVDNYNAVQMANSVSQLITA